MSFGLRAIARLTQLVRPSVKCIKISPQRNLVDPLGFCPAIRCAQINTYDQRSFSTAPIRSIFAGQLQILKARSIAAQQRRAYFSPKGKVAYLDFRHRFKTHHLRLHMLLVRKRKMSKHKKRKWRKKYKTVIAKKRLKREIAKEKTFRVELLTYIRRAEQFDPREYALKKIQEANSVKQPQTKQEKYEELVELIRINRYQTHKIKPKHKVADIDM